MGARLEINKGQVPQKFPEPWGTSNDLHRRRSGTFQSRDLGGTPDIPQQGEVFYATHATTPRNVAASHVWPSLAKTLGYLGYLALSLYLSSQLRVLTRGTPDRYPRGTPGTPATRWAPQTPNPTSTTPDPSQETPVNLAVITRTEAVQDIADHFADRTAYLITVPPELITEMAHLLRHVPDWYCYLNDGTDAVLRATDPGTLLAARTATSLFGIPCIGVLVIPKTVKAATIRRIFGDTIPTDGSRNVLTLQGPDDNEIKWPALLVEALDIADPAGAASIRANQTANLS